MKTIKINRSYTLKIYGSKSKFEDLKWSSYQYTKLTNAFINHLYFNNIKFYSTKGLGLLGNQAQQKALGIVKSKKSIEISNDHKKSVPNYSVETCYANIQKQKSNSHYNYKINFTISLAEERSHSRYVFAKSTFPLKQSLKSGWKISNQCELFFNQKSKHWYVRVYVSKKIKKTIPKNHSIGIDVGTRQVITTSEGYLGNSLTKRIKKLNESKKEKARQFALAKNRRDSVLVEKMSKNLNKNKLTNKLIIKQLLDKEAKKVVARGQALSSNLVVEDPKVLANLKSRGLERWAKTYFAYRLQVLGKERGVFVVFTNPAYTSITCYKCGDKDKENRDKLKFHCLKCGHKDHSDINAAKNLSRKGQEYLDNFVIPKIRKNTFDPVRALSDVEISMKQKRKTSLSHPFNKIERGYNA